jgi:hypothetical protein
MGLRKVTLVLVGTTVLVAVAAFTLSKTLRRRAFNSAVGNEYKIVGTFPSPNGGHTATKYIGMGGGAAGWCSQRVSINSRGNPFELEKEWSAGDYVFSVSCGSNIGVSWDSETSLRISYDTQTTAGVSTYQRPLSPDGIVKISYLSKGLALQ